MDPYEQSQDPSFLGEENEHFEDEFSRLEESIDPPQADFYGVLNVEKEASNDEIKEAYRRLSRIFHPDKHLDPQDKRAAETKFQVIQKAYEVLTDPNKRVIYDMFGEEGLNNQWVGVRLKTPQELREEFEKQSRLKREQEVDSIVRSKGLFQFNIDATQVFNPYYGTSKKARNKSASEIVNIASNVEITQLFLKHSFEVPVTEQTNATFVGQMISRNGIGGGNVVGTLRRTFSPRLWAEVGVSVVKPRLLSGKVFYNIDANSFVTVTSQSHAISTPPAFQITGGRRIGANTTGYLTYKTGVWSLGPWGRGDTSIFARRDKSAVAIGFNGGEENSDYSFELQTGINQSHVSATYGRKLSDDYHVRGAATLSTTSGLTVTFSGDGKATTNSHVNLSMEFGIPSGVTFTIRISRLGQKIAIPILLSSEFDIEDVLWGTLLPVGFVYAVDRLLLKPRRKKKKQEKLAALRERHAEYIAKQKNEAEETIRLSEPSVNRKIEAERAKDGLIIVEAWYGNLTNNTTEAISPDDPHIIDVRIPVQALVNNSQMVIPGGRSKAHLMGFYDPCMGEKKQLKIKYLFKKRLHEITVDDKTPVACPLRSHIIGTDR